MWLSFACLVMTVFCQNFVHDHFCQNLVLLTIVGSDTIIQAFIIEWYIILFYMFAILEKQHSQEHNSKKRFLLIMNNRQKPVCYFKFRFTLPNNWQNKCMFNKLCTQVINLWQLVYTVTSPLTHTHKTLTFCLLQVYQLKTVSFPIWMISCKNNLMHGCCFISHKCVSQKVQNVLPLSSFFFAFISRERPLQMQALFSVFILTNVACMAPKMFQDYYYGGTHTHWSISMLLPPSINID